MVVGEARGGTGGESGESFGDRGGVRKDECAMAGVEVVAVWEWGMGMENGNGMEGRKRGEASAG